MSSSSGSDSTAYLAGAGGGAVAWLVGYALTYALGSGMVERALQRVNFFADLLGGDPVPTWKSVAWLYFNAQFVSAEVTGLPGGTQTVDLLAQSESGTGPLFYLIPPVVLFVTALVVTYVMRVEGPRESLLSGVSTVGGYLLLSVVFAFLAGHAFGADVQAAPTLVTAVVLAGLVYPAVFGGLGGAVANYLQQG